MAKYDWFDGGYDKPKEIISEPAVHGEPLLEGWTGLLIFILGMMYGLVLLLWKPVVWIGAIWLGYEFISVIVEDVQGVI